MIALLLFFHHLVSLNFFISLQVNQKSRFSPLSKETLLTVFISNQEGNTFGFSYWLELRFSHFFFDVYLQAEKMGNFKENHWLQSRDDLYYIH